MKFNHTLLFIAMGSLGLNTATEAALTKNTLLTMDPAVIGCVGGVGTPPGSCSYGTTVTSGSYFAMGAVRVALSPGPDGGIFMEQNQPASGSHGGSPDSNESPSIDAPWGFFCNTGMHYTTIPVTVINPDVNGDGLTQTLDFSGWTVAWNYIPEINIGDIATITCSAAGCPVGSTYVMDYATTIPPSSLHNFGGVGYSFQMVGTVTAIPLFDVTADPVMPVFDGSPVIIDVLANDTRVTTYSFAPVLDSATVQVVSPASFGTTTVNGDGTITYNRSALDYASVDTFTYTVDDDAGFTSSETTVTVAGTNPVVSSDTGVTESDLGSTFNVATNATDNTGIAAATVLVDTAPVNGAINNPGDGTLTYTPKTGFTGIDTFTVTIEDDAGNLSSPTTQSVIVNAILPGSDNGDFVAGAAATGVGKTTGGGLTADEVGVDADAIQQCVGGCVDFVINTLNAGDSVKVVVPLSAAIPANAMYRKLAGGAWVDFVSDTDNALASAAPVSTAPLVCPEAGNAAYASGLTEGDVCLQITMNEGGSNDADGVADGSLMDPGGISVAASASAPAPASSGGGNSGCSISDTPTSLKQHGDWWIVVAFLAFLGLIRRKATH